jgi:hypothetical protein
MSDQKIPEPEEINPPFQRGIRFIVELNCFDEYEVRDGRHVYRIMGFPARERAEAIADAWNARHERGELKT